MSLRLLSPRVAMLSTAAVAGVAIVAMNVPASATSKGGPHRDNTGSYSDSVSGGAILGAVNTDGSNPFNDYGVEGKVSNDTGGVGVLGYGQQAKSYGAYGVSFGTNGIGVYGAGDGPAPSSGATPSSTQQSTGVVGNSASGDGVYGSTQFPNESDPVLSPVAGVVGYDSSGVAYRSTENSGVEGISSGGIGVTGYGPAAEGVFGVSNSGTGVFGTSSSGDGLYGQSTSSVGVVGDSSSSYGVEGVGSSTYGVYGVSADADGIVGTASSTGTYGVGGVGAGTGSGVGGSTTSSTAFGMAANNAATTGYGDDGGAGLLAESSLTPALIASTISADSPAAEFTTTGGGLGVDISAKAYGAQIQTTQAGVGLQIQGPRGTNSGSIVAIGNGQTVFSVDGNGDLYYTGTMTADARTRNGYTARTYAARQSSPSIEDVGSAQLVNGMSSVRLDPALIEQMDHSSAYHVFVTPDGETRGLYVAARTPTAFTVRENASGRSNVQFEYRIVATVDGQAGTRMSLSRGAQQTAFVPKFRKVRFVPLQSIKRPTFSKDELARLAKARQFASEKFDANRIFHPRMNASVEGRVR